MITDLCGYMPGENDDMIRSVQLLVSWFLVYGWKCLQKLGTGSSRATQLVQEQRISLYVIQAGLRGSSFARA